MSAPPPVIPIPNQGGSEEDADTMSSKILVAVACLVTATLYLTGTPIAVWVRRLRPLLFSWGLLAWLAYRLWSAKYKEEEDELPPSLLELFLEALTTLQLFLMDLEPSLPPILRRWLVPVFWTGWQLMLDCLGLWILLGVYRGVYCLWHYTLGEWKDLLTHSVFEFARHNIMGVQAHLHRTSQEFNKDVQVTVLRKKPDRVQTLTLPEKGRPHAQIVEELQEHVESENQPWKDGRVSGTVYPSDEAHSDLMNQVYSVYSWSNPLHPGMWPKLNQCEGEVIAMTWNVLHGTGDDALGCITSGGTESIVLAVRAHLHTYGHGRGIQHPEIVCGSTAHAALNKACDMMGIRQVSIDCSRTHHRLDPAAVRRRVTSNTIMIYASAPCYAQGTIDPIEDLSAIAVKYDIGLHVDACLGGFVLPFCEDAPKFDFRLPGVTSMSADTHKYGLAAKGTSVVLYRSKELRHGQYFAYPNWTGGLYSTPTLAGSRPGALSACAWAALVSSGQQGYQRNADSVVQASRKLAAGIQQIPGLELLSERPYMVVCWGASPGKKNSPQVDIYRVLDALTERGWSLNSLQSPACIHICMTLNTVPKVDLLLKDLKEAVKEVRVEGTEGHKKGTAGMYGVVGSVPSGPVQHVLREFTDATLAP